MSKESVRASIFTSLRGIVTSEPSSASAVEVTNPESAAVSSNRHTARPHVGTHCSQNNTKGAEEYHCVSVINQIKPKTPRKSKLISDTEEEDWNGACDSTTNPTASLIKRMRLDTTPTNGIISSPKKISPSRARKERSPKTSPNDKPKRKYTKRKAVENPPSFQVDQTEIPVSTVPGIPQSGTTSLSQSNNSSDNPWLNSTSPSSAEPGSHLNNPSGLKSPRMHGNVSPTRQPKRLLDEGCETRETRVPNNNTHLLLSPQTLKRMLRSPSPASQNANVWLSDDDLDEEIIKASNSLFKDMSLRRGEEVGSPSHGSYASSSSTTSSNPHGRGRYSRRKFGRLYPSFDPNHCLHSHCLEGTLTGSKYCAAHAKGHLSQPSSSLYSQCIYTDPVSLKPCKKTVYGEDEREFKFCGLHAERVTATRLRVQRLEQSKVEDETMDSLMEELERCLGDTNDTVSSSSLTLNKEDGREVPIPVSPHGDKDDLKDFFVDNDTKLVNQSRTLLQFSRSQPDQDSDEDINETGDDDPLKHARYYSTDEVISIHRSRLDKLRSLYQSQFSALKDAYLECRQRCVDETERNEQRRFSFTSDPKFIGIRNSKITEKYKEEELERREKSLALMRHRHRFGAKKVAQLQAMRANEKDKIVVFRRETEGVASGDNISERCENPYDLSRCETFKIEKGVISSLNDNGDKTLTSIHSTQRPCIFSSDTATCSNLPLPFSNFCRTHILNDPDQMLYGQCGRAIGDTTDVCTTSTLRGLEKFGCMFHILAEVSDPKPSEEEARTMADTCLTLPFAESEEEQNVLEDLVAKETFNLTHFDRAVKHLAAKAYDIPDTEESDAGEDEEEDEAFKDLLLDELRINEPNPKPIKQTRRSSTKQLTTEDPTDEPVAESVVKEEVKEEVSTETHAIEASAIPEAIDDLDEPQPTLVLLLAE